MAIIIILAILIYILSFMGSKKTKNKNQNKKNYSSLKNAQKTSSKPLTKSYAEKKPVSFDKKSLDIKQNLDNNIYNSDGKTLSHQKSIYEKGYKYEEKIDKSIIDITDYYYTINSKNELTEYENVIPKWNEDYVFSYSELETASQEQKKFYLYFKEKYTEGIFLNLKGNTNYALILVFDILNNCLGTDYINKTEKELNTLGSYYPEIKSYINSYLQEKKLTLIKNEQVIQIIENLDKNYDLDSWRLGNKYAKTLNLSVIEVNQLNKIWIQRNNFNTIEYCNIEIIKLYLKTIKFLDNSFKLQNSTLELIIQEIANLVATKQYRYRNGSQNYQYAIESIINEIHVTIYKYCENLLRENYNHKRKVNLDSSILQKDAKLKYEEKILNLLNDILPSFIPSITQPDIETEIELNAQNTNRWKTKFEDLTSKYDKKPQKFIDDILHLGELNNRNPSIENIFFEASKFMSQHDKLTALKLYIYYLNYDLKSSTFNNKQLTKSIQKNLFKTREEFENFEKIVSDYIEHKNLEKALNETETIFEIKRKKIKLDTTSINEVQKQHSGTVELLNEYLKDDDDLDQSVIKWNNSKNDEIEIIIRDKQNQINNSKYIVELNFSHIQIATLDFFAKSNFTISVNEIELFAKSNGLFKNQLIESINELSYDYLDDILIEEDGEYYTINNNYYQKLLIK